MRHVAIILALGLGLFSSLTVHAADKDLFESRQAGISVTKPADWVFLSAQTVMQNLAVPRLRDQELERTIRSSPSIPFLVVARHTEPYTGLNPTLQVSYKTQGELRGQGAVALLKRSIENLKGNFQDLAVVEDVAETKLDGQPAAKVVARYIVKDGNGTEYPTVARMWIVPRGEYMLTINMYAPPSGPDTSEAEFAKILQSIKLKPL